MCWIKRAAAACQFSSANHSSCHIVSYDTSATFLLSLYLHYIMVTINACLSYFDFKLPSELLLKRYEKYLLKRGLS